MTAQEISHNSAKSLWLHEPLQWCGQVSDGEIHSDSHVSEFQAPGSD